jgi:hypothetical protein
MPIRGKFGCTARGTTRSWRLPFRLTFDNLASSSSAIPEPSTYTLLAGLVGLGVVGLLRRQAARKTG